ncbi:MAG: LytTR family transcriptional regulator DNA-binding domain-containing protein [Gloeobacteraceae cyanobacterium ES-bin-316]|nr:LytTR family transcriptional regulator DNA-binding domain-containing protein [Ferruginibacter sp.]
MKKVQVILNRLYPLEERKPAQIKLAFLLGSVVFLFMFLIQPFGKKPDTPALLLDSSYAGLLTFVSIIFVFFAIFPLFPNFFKEEKWTIGREAILTLIIIASIASANVLAGHFIWAIPLSIPNWLRMIFYTAVIGIAPAIISILLNQARLLKKYRKEVSQINNNLLPVTASSTIKSYPQESRDAKEAEPISDDLLTIEAENEKDNLVIRVHSFLAASSADNYVKVFYMQNAQLKTFILRTTLKKLEENALPFPMLFRCHRTALVNMAAVQNLSGSAQGYRLTIAHLPDEIPVSRNLNQVIKEKLAAIHP